MNQQPTTNNQQPSEERLAFDAVPEIYDRVRPSYPEPLFDEIFSYAGVAPERARILEIGAGTGKATRSLLERGALVTAVEIGPHLAAFLRDNLGTERLSVINGSFEGCELPNASFDAVVSATAFHWVQPDVRVKKSRSLLRTGGALAVIGTNQISSETDRGYFTRSQHVYRRYYPDEETPETPGEDVVPPEYDELRSSGLFEDVTLHRYRWDQTYPIERYADLMRSYAGMQMMEPAAREALIAELAAVIDSEYGGSVTRPLVITLTLGRKPMTRQ